jgi:hypothetical protein
MRHATAVTAGLFLLVGMAVVGAGEKNGDRIQVVVGYSLLGAATLMILVTVFPPFGPRRRPPTNT